MAEDSDSSAHARISQSSQQQEAAGNDAESRSSGPAATSSGQATEYCIVNFYHLTDVNHPFQVRCLPPMQGVHMQGEPPF